jgi:hypothetical protein
MDENTEQKKRGRKPSGRSERITFTFTPEEMRECIVAAALADGGPFDVKEWGRDLLVQHARTLVEESKKR